MLMLDLTKESSSLAMFFTVAELKEDCSLVEGNFWSDKVTHSSEKG